MTNDELAGLIRWMRRDQATVIDLLDAGAGTPEIDAVCRRMDDRMQEIELAVRVRVTA